MKMPKRKKLVDGYRKIYKNPNFNSQVTRKYRALRKRKKTHGFDFTIKVAGSEIPVHKEVLLKRCEHFHPMLQLNCKDTFSNSVEISYNPDATIWSQIIDYLYSGTITITIENMFEIYTTSKYLRLSQLSEFCKLFIKNSINHETVGKIHAIARQNFLSDIVKSATSFIETNFEDFTKHSDMLEWSSELVEELLKSDKLQIRSEATVIQLVCNWINFKFDSRQSLMDKLLVEVRYSFLTREKIIAAIDDDVEAEIRQRCCYYMAIHTVFNLLQRPCL